MSTPQAQPGALPISLACTTPQDAELDFCAAVSCRKCGAEVISLDNDFPPNKTKKLPVFSSPSTLWTGGAREGAQCEECPPVREKHRGSFTPLTRTPDTKTNSSDGEETEGGNSSSSFVTPVVIQQGGISLPETLLAESLGPPRQDNLAICEECMSVLGFYDCLWKHRINLFQDFESKTTTNALHQYSETTAIAAALLRRARNGQLRILLTGLPDVETALDVRLLGAEVYLSNGQMFDEETSNSLQADFANLNLERSTSKRRSSVGKKDELERAIKVWFKSYGLEEFLCFWENYGDLEQILEDFLEFWQNFGEYRGCKI